MGKITELGEATLPLAATDTIEVVQGIGFVPASKKVQIAELGTNFEVAQQRMAGTTLFADEFNDISVEPGWVKVSSGGNVNALTWREGGDGISAKVQGLAYGSTAGRPAALLRPFDPGVTSSPFTIDMCHRRAHSISNYIMYGPLLTASTTQGTGTIIWYMSYTTSYGVTHSVRWGSSNWDVPNDFGSPTWSGAYCPHVYQRVVYKGGSDWQFYVSGDGYSWVDHLNGVKTLAFTPTHFGFGFGTWGSAGIYGHVSTDYIRVYAGDLGADPVQAYDDF